MKPSIVVVGSSNTDMIIKSPHLPMPGETVLGSEFHMVNGGKGANQAIAAARAGGDVDFIACVGDDTFGKGALENLKNEGIGVTGIKIVENTPSGIALINVSESGENSISVAPGANNQLLPEDIEQRESIIKNADAVLIQLEIPIETVYTTIRIAKRYVVPVILNPAPAQKIDPEILALVTIITPNENEAVELVSIPENNVSNSVLIEELKKLGLETIIITLGANGVLFSANGRVGQLGGNKVEVMDTTAAGDTFNGYLAVSLAKGDSIEHAIRMANFAASLSVTRMGASSSIPYLDEVMAII
ncbi:MAG: ribokinase [Bacteroidales bacterium]